MGTRLTLDNIKLAQDNWESLHKYNDQIWATQRIRRLLREQGFVVIRTKTTADDLAFDLGQTLRVIWVLPK